MWAEIQKMLMELLQLLWITTGTLNITYYSILLNYILNYILFLMLFKFIHHKRALKA